MKDARDHRIDELIRKFEERPGWVPYMRGLRNIPDVNRNLSSTMLDWAEKHLGEKWATILAEGYVSFVSDVNRSQIRYEATGHYLNSNYAQVFASVYGNEEFMRCYHWGVYVSTFAWPHHHDLVRFFRERFVTPYLVEVDAKRIVDLGCGSGIWSLISLAATTSLHSDGVDISETSTRQTRAMSQAIGLDQRFNVHCADALCWGNKENLAAYDVGLSCFLLEHLETPLDLLANLARLIRPRGMAFVTCALTAAETDHIKEFRRESELVALAESAGFRVVEIMSAAPPNYVPNARFLPRSMAMILSKRLNEIW